MTHPDVPGYLRSRVAFIRDTVGPASATLLMLAAVAVHLLAAWRNVGFLNADEHYQILEFAQFKLGRQPASALAWEFPAQIRAGIQPWLAVGLVHVSEAFGLRSPFSVATVMRLLSSALALWAVLELCLRTLPPVRQRWLKLVALGSAAFFWIAPVAHGRFSSENWGGALLVAALCLTLDAANGWDSTRGSARWRLVAAGLLGSAAFYSRFQLGFAIAGLAGWLLIVRRTGPSFLVLLAVSFLAGCALNTVIDHWMYGVWVCSPYNYFMVNLVSGKASSFGVEPWWMLLVYMLVVLIPPFSLPLLALLFAGSWFARRHVLVWVTVPFVLVHMLVGHKEPRFLLPILFMLGPWFAVAVDAVPWDLAARLGAWMHTATGRVVIGAWVAADLALMGVLAVMPVNDRLPIYQWLWQQSQQAPLTLAVIGTSPFALSDEHPETTVSYYVPPRLTMAPLPAVLATGAPGAPYVYYRGNELPLELRALGDCPPVARAYPEWVTRYALVTGLASITQTTVCRLERRRAG